MTASRKDKKEQQTELKELPVVAKYEGSINQLSWLSPTEICLEDYYDNKTEVLNIETKSVTQLAKEPIRRYRNENEYTDKNVYINSKLQISENEFLITTRSTMYVDRENPDLILDGEQLQAIKRKNQEEKKPEIEILRWKQSNSWGIYRKNKDGKYASLQETVQPILSEFDHYDLYFNTATLSENHIAIFNTGARKIDFWERISCKERFQHTRTLDLSHTLNPVDTEKCFESSLIAANPSTLIYTQLVKEERDRGDPADHQVILKIDCNTYAITGELKSNRFSGLGLIRPDKLRRLNHPTNILYYCDSGSKGDNWFHGTGVLFDATEMALYKLPLSLRYHSDEDYCSISEKGLLAFNNAHTASYDKVPASVTVYQFPHDDVIAKNREIASTIRLALSKHLFDVLIGVINEYALVVDLPKLYGKPFWSAQLKSPDKIEVEEKVEEEKSSHKKCCIII